MNWKKLNEEYRKTNKNLLEYNKYYELLVEKHSHYVTVQATKTGRPSMSSYQGGGYQPRFQWDMFDVYAPNWFEKFLNITFEDKVNKSIKKVKWWIEKRNQEIYEVSKLNV